MEKQKIKIELNENISIPLVERLAEYFRERICAGDLKKGDCLPKNDCIEGVSHVTVIKAYKKLASEGLVRSIRARGTMVTADVNRSSYAFLTISTMSNFNSLLINSFQQQAYYRGNPPHVFFANLRQKTDAKTPISMVLRKEVEAGRIRGVVLTMHDHYPGLIEWLRGQNVPMVLLGSNDRFHRVITNKEESIRRARVILGEKGCDSIHLYDSNPSVFPGCHPGTNIHRIRPSNDSIDETCESIAEELIQEYREESENRLGLIFTDDFVTIKVSTKLRESGIHIPKDVRVVAITHESQLLRLMNGVDLLLLDVNKMIAEGCELIEEVIKTSPSATLTRTVDFEKQ